MTNKKQGLKRTLYIARGIAGIVLIAVLSLAYLFLTPWQMFGVAFLVVVSFIFPVIGTCTSLIFLFPFGYVAHHCPFCHLVHLEKPEVKGYNCSECGERDWQIHHADLDDENTVTFCSDACRSDYEYFGGEV